MKKLILSAFFMLPLLGFAQNKFSVAGRFTDSRSKGRVYLMFTSPAGPGIDSADVIAGGFSVKGTIAGFPDKVVLKYSPAATGFSAIDFKTSFLNLFVDAPETKLEITDKVSDAVVSGSKTQLELPRYLDFINVPIKVEGTGMLPVNGLVVLEMSVIKGTKGMSMGDLAPKSKEAPAALALTAEQNEEMKERLRLQDLGFEMRADAMRTRRLLQRKFIVANPDSYFSLLALREAITANINISAKEVEGLFLPLSDRVKSTREGISMAKWIEKEKANPTIVKSGEEEIRAHFERQQELLKGSFKVGEVLPDFSLNDQNGKAVKLSDYRGKYVLVDFWASWCVPCRKENPSIKAAYNKYKSKGFMPLGVSLELKGDREKWLAAIEKDGLTWPQVVDYDGFDSGVAKQFKLRAIPQNYLVGPDGKIIATTLRGEDLELKLAELFK